ncbi:MAG: hypothetical protein N2166_00870 [candidate division WOR-3 bacterium]|nr:hypothetical protein [candidate division WOR-3 bacterium]
MGHLCNALFWGTIIIIIGILIILNATLGIKLPIFRIFLGVLFLYLGLKIIVGTSAGRSYCRKASIYKEVSEKIDKYDIVFSNQKLDFSGFKLKSGRNDIEINIAFGGGEIKINPTLPVKIKANVAFGSAHFPDGTTIGFGAYTYKTPSYEEDTTSDYLFIKLNIAFGNATIVAD